VQRPPNLLVKEYIVRGNKMAKRFTDTDKWDKKWFSELSSDEKVLWFYLLDKCNHAGFLDFNLRTINFMTNTTFTIDDIKTIFNKQVLFFDNNEKCYIIDFIDFQYGELNPKVNAHKSVLKILDNYEKKYNLSTLVEGFIKGSLTLKDKDMDKDQDKDKDKDIKVEKNKELDFVMSHYQFEIRKKLTFNPLVKPNLIQDTRALLSPFLKDTSYRLVIRALELYLVNFGDELTKSFGLLNYVHLNECVKKAKSEFMNKSDKQLHYFDVKTLTYIPSDDTINHWDYNEKRKGTDIKYGDKLRSK
jgi:hypothetical protein